MKRTILIAVLASLATGMPLAAQSPPALRNNTGRPASVAAPSATVVLVHGAFADATGWKHVIPMLEADGFQVIAVQNPLSSLAADVANTRRVIDAQTGPVIVVGHSYGGSVMTEAAANHPNVKALVFVAAFAPDAGETGFAMLGKGPPTPLVKALVPDTGGYLYIDRTKFREVFSQDVSAAESHIMAVTQKPVFAHIFEEAPTVAAWKSLPTWYLVSQKDNVIHPELQRMLAKRMNATVREVNSSHVSLLVQPREVARMVKQAADATVR